MKSKKFIFALPLVLASIAIFIASHQEGVPFDEDIFIFQDKVLHFCAYFIYGITIQFYLHYFRLSKTKFIFFTILIGALFGMSDEFHQYFVPNRSTDIFDWLADVFGVMSSLSLLKLIEKAYFSILNKIELK